MLLRQEVLKRIAAGEVTLAFRRWRKPTVKAGGRLRTSIGELAIDELERVSPSAITDQEARKAGHRSADELRTQLARFGEGEVYRIALRLAGPDPRVALRRSSRLSAGDRAELAGRLARLDRNRPWTKAVLGLIDRKPGVAAAHLAAMRKQEKADFKRDVRKLKELGLTESLEVGYRLSPRGRAALAFLGKVSASKKQ